MRALIFDMDGVIADTIELHYRAWVRLCQEEGIPFTRDDNERIRGLTRRDTLTYLLRGRAVDADAMEALMARKNDYFLELLREMTPQDCLPGIVPLLSEAKAAGIRLGLASNSQNVLLVLDQLNLRDAFDAIADHHTVMRTKPAPDLFIWTAGRLNVTPPEVLIVEDSAVGVEAARAGGFRVVGVGDPAALAQANHVYASLEGVSLAELAGICSA